MELNISFFKEKEKLWTFQAYIQKSKSTLYRIAYVYVKNEHDALEIISEAVFKGYKNLRKLRDIEAIDKWMKRIVINCSIDYIKKNSKTEMDIELFQNQLSYKDNIYEDLYEAIEFLDLELKSVIILKYFEGHTISETAEILNLSEAHIKNKLHKALKQLRLELVEE